jgi:hypothetical protein
VEPADRNARYDILMRQPRVIPKDAIQRYYRGIDRKAAALRAREAQDRSLQPTDRRTELPYDVYNFHRLVRRVVKVLD